MIANFKIPSHFHTQCDILAAGIIISVAVVDRTLHAILVISKLQSHEDVLNHAYSHNLLCLAVLQCTFSPVFTEMVNRCWKRSVKSLLKCVQYSVYQISSVKEIYDYISV